ncbi:transcriptional regulator [Ralstonia phage Cimandef]|uniref:KilA-N domain-containing protein n=1 Tax=Ralstonia phage Cimandef TaxID=2759720 RepID=A0A7G5B8N2_9CAUD|nr:transcriptional regulator [Ralstonia phage Cimandef]QMV32655.1 hypothetical protein B2_00021 [Ralstonia phage Cimandef]
MNALIVVDGVGVRRDADGRYCLNDLHRAAGAEKRHGPSYWLANTTTAALVDELRTTGIPVVTLEGAAGGTYVARELVYAYAMWISPSFHLKVIRTFDAAVSAPAQFKVPSSLSEALRLAADQAEQIERQAAQIEHQRPAVEFHARYVEADGSKGFREVCKLLKANESEFREFLLAKGVMYRLSGRLVPYSQHMDAGRFEIKAGVSGNEHAYNQSRFTPKGVQWIAGLWMAAQLPEQVKA